MGTRQSFILDRSHIFQSRLLRSWRRRLGRGDWCRRKFITDRARLGLRDARCADSGRAGHGVFFRMVLLVAQGFYHFLKITIFTDIAPTSIGLADLIDDSDLTTSQKNHDLFTSEGT